ncbi:MAG TPA: hypothetical protein VEU11_03000 [Terriglobales bacterium]|nr:hypothetical protein [Terriglobales bacterium]
MMDNLNIHRRKSLTDLLGGEVGGEVWDRFTVHYADSDPSRSVFRLMSIAIPSVADRGSERMPIKKGQ